MLTTVRRPIRSSRRRPPERSLRSRLQPLRRNRQSFCDLPVCATTHRTAGTRRPHRSARAFPRRTAATPTRRASPRQPRRSDAAISRACPHRTPNRLTPSRVRRRRPSRRRPLARRSSASAATRTQTTLVCPAFLLNCSCVPNRRVILAVSATQGTRLASPSLGYGSRARGRLSKLCTRSTTDTTALALILL